LNESLLWDAGPKNGRGDILDTINRFLFEKCGGEGDPKKMNPPLNKLPENEGKWYDETKSGFSSA
jgi:hypothetical protein